MGGKSELLSKVLGLERRAQRPIDVWHASPHNFDKFDLDKIGTGQGAASYGHGFYAAENPAVSGPLGAYDLEFTTKKLRDAGWDMSMGLDDHAQAVMKGIRDGLTDDEIALANFNRLWHGTDAEKLADVKQYSEDLRANAAKLYDLRLHAAPEGFLDQDAMLQDMNPALLEKLQSLGVRPTQAVPTFKGGREIHEAFPPSDITERLFNSRILRQMGDQGGHLPSALDAVERLAQQLPTSRVALDRWLELRPQYEDAYSGMYMVPSRKTGKQVYDDLVKERETGSFLPPGELYANGKASRDLREAGVPGMRYLDGGSRSAGDGTRNYVIFDPEIIEIAKKYGLAPAAVGAGAMMGNDGAQAAEPTIDDIRAYLNQGNGDE